MKKIMYVLIIIIMFLMTFVQNVYAEEVYGERIKVGRISTKILDGSFIEDFKPGEEDKNSDAGKVANTILGKIVPIINKILSIIQVLGVILAVIAIAYFGFSIVISNSSEFLGPLKINAGLVRGGKKTPSDQKQLRNWMWEVLIGSILLFLGSSIVRIVFSVLSI